MGAASQTFEHKVSLPFETAFELTKRALSRAGIAVVAFDPLAGKIIATSEASLFSWGENITAFVEEIDEANSLLKIESALKVSFNIGGARRHKKNFDDIIRALNSLLEDI